MAYRRKKLNMRSSKKMFTRTAKGSHRKNFNVSNPMRGGIRL